MKNLVIYMFILIALAFSTKMKNSKKFLNNDNKNCLINEESYMKIYNEQHSDDIKRKLKFIHGNCPPVLLVPGLFGNSLYLYISDCESFLNTVDEGFKYHCPNANICKNKSINTHVEKIWPVMKGSFGLNSSENTLGVCFSYFLQYFNNKDSCPEQSNCRYSEYVRILPYEPEKVKENEKNIFKSACNIFDIFGMNLNIFNSKSSGVFSNLKKELKNIGYEKMFSLNVLPYDFKESICGNKLFANTFEKIIKIMYETTKKKVVIIAHSYGGLNSLYQITQNEGITSLIEELILVGSPLLGSPKSTKLILKGDKQDWILGLGMELSVTAQKMLFSRVPVSYQLLQTSVETYLEKDKDFLDAVKNTIYLQAEIKDKKLNCSNYYSLNDKSSIYSLFKNKVKFSNLNVITKEEENLFKSAIKVKNNENKILCTLPCNFNFYNIFDYDNVSIIGNYKNQIPQEALSSKKRSNNKNYKAQDIIDIMKNHYEVNKEFHSDIKIICEKDKDINKCRDYFDNEYNNKEKINQITESLYNQCRAFKENLAEPNVKTTIIFNKTIITRSGIVFDKNDIFNQEIEKYFYSGGDGTVPSESILIPGLKWLHNNKNIKFVDYCSTYIPNENSSVNGIGYNIKNEKKFLENTYIYLNCEKRGENLHKNLHNKNESQDSKHSEMIGDIYFVNYISLKMRNSYSHLKYNKAITSIIELLEHSKSIKDIIISSYEEKSYEKNK